MKSKLILAVAILLAAQTNFLRAEDVLVSDFGGKVTLIGRLGKPVGTVVTVEGQLVSEPKLGKSGRISAAFRANKVDGKALETGQIIALMFPTTGGMPPVHANEIVHLSGYEGGAFIGTPPDAREKMGADASPLSWKFESTLVVIKVEPSDSAKKP